MQFDLSPLSCSQREDVLRRLIASRHALTEEFRMLWADSERASTTRS